jgi:protein translocase SecG subunit
MKNALIIIQILLSIILTILIFLQATGESEFKSNLLSPTENHKRGWEKIMFDFTILILIIFLISSIVQTLI